MRLPAVERGRQVKVERNKKGALVVSAAALLAVTLALAGRIAGRIGITDPRVRVESRLAGEKREKDRARAEHYRVVERGLLPAGYSRARQPGTLVQLGSNHFPFMRSVACKST
jgi:hypothetical protein